MTATTRTFLTLGPAGLSLEWSNDDALEPDHLASSPATHMSAESMAEQADRIARASEPARQMAMLTGLPVTPTSEGGWIIHHPSRGGPSSGLRDALMTLAVHGRSCAALVADDALTDKGRAFVLGPSTGSIGCGFLAGKPRPRRKRPGQWTDRTRARRRRRLGRAAERRERERARREQGRRP